MRIWSLNPKYLDSKGLVALWRETLLAKKVLSGDTKGYINHPQLDRFKKSSAPLDYINYYLEQVWKEASARGYNFNKSKFTHIDNIKPISVNSGQVQYEFEHLLNKLKIRDNLRYNKNININIKNIELNSTFFQIQGGIESWEKM